MFHVKHFSTNLSDYCGIKEGFCRQITGLHSQTRYFSVLPTLQQYNNCSQNRRLGKSAHFANYFAKC